MLANQRALDISAHNVANVGTAGFRPARAVFAAQPSGGVEVSAAASPVLARSTPTADNAAVPSATDLARETVDSMIYQRGFEMSAKIVKMADQRLGTLIDLRA